MIREKCKNAELTSFCLNRRFLHNNEINFLQGEKLLKKREEQELRTFDSFLTPTESELVTGTSLQLPEVGERDGEMRERDEERIHGFQIRWMGITPRKQISERGFKIKLIC